MKPNKLPGSDVLAVEFYKIFWNYYNETWGYPPCGCHLVVVGGLCISIILQAVSVGPLWYIGLQLVRFDSGPNRNMKVPSGIDSTIIKTIWF